MKKVVPPLLRIVATNTTLPMGVRPGMTTGGLSTVMIPGPQILGRDGSGTPGSAASQVS